MQVARNGHGDRGREHPVRRSLAASGLEVVHVDPTRAARHTLARGISKTDRADARLIASMTLAGEYRPLVGHSPQAETLRVVAHAHRAAVADRAEALHCRRAALMRFWPAAVSVWPTSVGGLRSPQARAVLAAALTPQAAARLDRTRLAELLRAAGRTRTVQDEAERLRWIFCRPVMLLAPPCRGCRGPAHRTPPGDPRPCRPQVRRPAAGLGAALHRSSVSPHGARHAWNRCSPGAGRL
ncbi:IS110 family transposase [Streptomyces anthocyanicus]|uniref:IS110 family transposase n=1 Tax=Streptomyces anthocyanicus TaxID=68174 RepID=UPI00336ACF81